MKFLLDESVELRLSLSLKAQDHDVKTIGTDYSNSLEDAEVLKIARSEQRILITNDKDFGELVFHSHHAHAGVILLRLKGVPFRVKQERLVEVIATYKSALDHFLIVTLFTVRIRKSLQKEAA
jgi:predicted nuclease of predicted toxin-antitoxin system